MATPIAAPAPTSAQQILQAIQERPETDYIFHFWSALGWTVLTFGLYWFYVFYQLMRRSRDHNRRRLTLLLAGQDLAWQQALEQKKNDALAPAFERVRNQVQPLQALSDGFRDPTLWLLFSLIANGLVWLAAALLLDQDLVRHERHERAAEAELTTLFSEMGVALPAPVPAQKQPHNYVGRIVAVVFTFGLYSFWWVADLMREGNVNFEQDYAWEDALTQSAS